MKAVRLQPALCAFFAGLPAASLAAVLELPRTATDISIDGILDEAAWQDALQVELDKETRPGENLEAPVKTTAYLIEDGENLFLAFDAEDPDPNAIRAYLRDRDSAYSDDFVGIALDTYNDERRAFQFFANPLGVQMDLTNDDVNKNEDDSWDAIWSSAGRINKNGYVVEMRIPLSQLRFPNAAGKQTWGYDLLRFYPRDHRYRLSNNPLDRSRNCYLCQMSKFRGLEGSQPSRDLELVPTLTASRAESTDDPGFVPLRSGDAKVEGGLSLRWGMTPDLTANLAVNPDFSQVESDVAQLDVNERFALFFPEKRPFFLEGADYFETPLDAVFTRTVADPDFGAKLTGKRGANTFGIFAAQDGVTELLFPGLYGSDSTTLQQANTAFVGRYARGFGDASSIGGLVTVRDGDGYHNYLGGVDGRWKFNDQHSLQFQYLTSHTEYPSGVVLEFEQPPDAFDGNGTAFRYDYDSRNWFANAEYTNLSNGFRADAGFQTRVGGAETEVGLGRVWHGTPQSWWYRIRAQAEFEILHDQNGGLLERENSLRVGIGGPRQSWMQISFIKKDELNEGVMYEISRLRLYGEMTVRRGLELGLFTSIGDQIDYSNNRLGKRRLYEPFVNWNINRNLFLRFRGALSRLETQGGEQIFDATVADARLTWQFNLRSFLRLTVQHQDIETNPSLYVDDVDANSRDVGRQLLYSYKLNPHTVFFLGYSDRYIDDDNLDGLTVSDRTWFMKIGYAWTP
ncbi:MAG: carbohydrate binding family 9 domain-containing protein [Gammaproteobacteria bacterium]|nr:carbohydrate binding family 9 domain-containing protein [Gammaproteobacteria bacterium]